MSQAHDGARRTQPQRRRQGSGPAETAILKSRLSTGSSPSLAMQDEGRMRNEQQTPQPSASRASHNRLGRASGLGTRRPGRGAGSDVNVSSSRPSLAGPGRPPGSHSGAWRLMAHRAQMANGGAGARCDKLGTASCARCTSTAALSANSGPPGDSVIRNVSESEGGCAQQLGPRVRRWSSAHSSYRRWHSTAI